MAREIRIVFVVIGRRHQHVDVAADNLVLLVPEQSDRRRIEGFNAAVRVDHDDAVHGGIDDRSPARLTGAQLILELRALCEVVQHARELAFALNRHLSHGQMEREGAAIASTPGHLTPRPDDPCKARVEILIEVPVVLVVVRRRHQHLDVATHHFRRRVSE